MLKKYMIAFFLPFLFACQPGGDTKESAFRMEYEKFVLENGLEVILHVDRSDPVVSVVLAAHVGSAREKTGRTGFAHMFEHLLFLESENLGRGGLDQLSARIGGAGANGFTNNDITTYFQTVPKDALEKMIWAEADKLGWFINTVTDPVLANEIMVVKNEKRQVVDNRPYGHTNFVITKNMYPEGHPYSWTVIGSLADLQASTLEDVQEFYKQWYVPNNTTLVIAGDIDIQQTREWVKKYFDEIPRGKEVEALNKNPGRLDATKHLYHEDNFAKVPELTLTWPTVESYHSDYYPLRVLAEYLSVGKRAPLYKVLVEEQKLTAGVSMFNYSNELAGQMYLSVRAFRDTYLDTAFAAIQKALGMFENEGLPETDLQRIIAGMETDFYRQLSDVSGKGIQLAHNNILTGDPGYSEKELEQLLRVTTDDVSRVYKTYLKGRDFIATSFVPKGQDQLSLEGSVKASVVEESIEEALAETYDLSQKVPYEKTPSSFDRSKEPPYGSSIELPVPLVWEEQLSNGIRVYGIENREVPLVHFSIYMEGGQLLETHEQAGITNILAEMMNRGTQSKTPEELENAIKQLGSSIQFNSGQEEISITGVSLARNYQATMELLEEMLLEPRWDEAELELVKMSVESRLVQQAGNPNAIASNAFNKLIYGEEDIRSKNRLGSVEIIRSINMEDLQAHYDQHINPSLTRWNIVGAVEQKEVMQSLNSLNERWKKKEAYTADISDPESLQKKGIYFYDVPDAKQSMIYLGYPALAETDPDHYPATVMNYILGGGGFASRLTQDLRVEKGYTYGIGSAFTGSAYKGPFRISTSVQSKITLEAAQSIKKIVEEYGSTFTEADLATTKGFLIKSNARQFESAWAKLNFLNKIGKYKWTPDYIREQEAIVNNMTVEKIESLANKYLELDQMVWLVVGDANSQKKRMQELGAGEPLELNTP
jgi:zinc protease